MPRSRRGIRSRCTGSELPSSICGTGWDVAEDLGWAVSCRGMESLRQLQGQLGTSRIWRCVIDACRIGDGDADGGPESLEGLRDGCFGSGIGGWAFPSAAASGIPGGRKRPSCGRGHRTFKLTRMNLYLLRHPNAADQPPAGKRGEIVSRH